MIDPIGGFYRIRDFFISYVETAFRIADPDIQAARHQLLTKPGSFAAIPFIEPIVRYESSKFYLEDLLEKSDILKNISLDGRIAFIELALSGLFPGKHVTGNKGLKRESLYKPYTHQMDMLRRGLTAGTPGIVTSGTGSGKTESFMLPVIAQISAEAVGWAPPSPNYLKGTWWRADRAKYEQKRVGENRPAAIRALVLYPMNALVADQMVRLRKALDSEVAREVMDTRFKGNRIFFGQYNGETPVAGYHTHPRLSNDEKEKKRVSRRRARMKAAMKSFDAAQQDARSFDEAASTAAERQGIKSPEPTRFIFPALDGGEMVSRWDMQNYPPDILVSNPSMLSAMLAREIEEDIFVQTKNWLHSNPDAYFFLIFDELHLLRGSAGTETSFLIKSLLVRLGLDEPNHRHKLRILASSASLPINNDRADDSLTYLRDLLAPFGTFSGLDSDGSTEKDFWRNCIVPGQPRIPDGYLKTLRPQPFVDLLEACRNNNEMAKDISPEQVENSLNEIAKEFCLQQGLSASERNAQISEHAGKLITLACINNEEEGIRATAASIVSSRIFNSNDVNEDALRGLLLTRALAESKVPCRELDRSIPSFRVHTFVRNIEGLFGSVSPDAENNVKFADLTMERGFSHTKSSKNTRGQRLFEFLYCEACGELFVGGQKGEARVNSSHDGIVRVELLPSTPNLEKLPNEAAVAIFDNQKFDEFAVFWPSSPEVLPKEPEKDFDKWELAILDPALGLVEVNGTMRKGCVSGRLYFQKDTAVSSSGAPKTAQPFCCPKCGTDYSPRPKSSIGRLSPIRAFRTGFAKASQLFATELFELLHSVGEDAKTIVFSDSRQDAANTAFEVEKLHRRDLTREVFVTTARSYLQEMRARYVPKEKQNEAIQEILADPSRRSQLGDLINEWHQEGPAIENGKVKILHLIQHDSVQVSKVAAEFVRLGMHPSDERGKAYFIGKPWYEQFINNDGKIDFSPGLTSLDQGKIVNEIMESQQAIASEIIFSNSFFALEETGLAYPSIAAEQNEYIDKLDAWIRVFASAYRIKEHRFSINQRSWESGEDVPRKTNRVYKYADALHKSLWSDGLTVILDDLRNYGHSNGQLKIEKLYLRLTEKQDPYWRCESCGRVHLHIGHGICTRCYTELSKEKTGLVEELWSNNFVAERIVRGERDNVPRFRLTSEELTGQTDDFADRLRRFKGIFVGHMPQIQQAALSIDLLSVTTTMEVGIDIGSLNTVFQANMPPQRFNYQQRVGRAGRRGQAFSFVLTFCRGRTHDEHYFRHPEAITGDPPPPPFLAVKHKPIPMRLARKYWLHAAFAAIREECSRNHEIFPADELIPPDIHGEFILTTDYYSPGSVWPARLKSALTKTRSSLERFLFSAIITSEKNEKDAQVILRELTADNLIREIAEVGDEQSVPKMGLGEFLAERGLLPMYGMPTRVRNLYLGLLSSRSNSEVDIPEWSVIDRDIDIAIAEFAPGNVLLKDKVEHLSVGFTGTLSDPIHKRSGVELGDPLTDWYTDKLNIGFCCICGAANTAFDKPSMPIECNDCHELVPTDAFTEYYTPAGFRTVFGVTKEEQPYRRMNLTTVATLLREGTPATYANTTVKRGAGITIIRMNQGEIGDQGNGQGFNVNLMTDSGVHIPNNRTQNNLQQRGVLKNQAIVEDLLPKSGAFNRWFPTGERVGPFGLMSRKETDALYLELREFDPRLAFDLVARNGQYNYTSARAAAISATHIIIQEAAVALDISPEEFEALEPRRRANQPILQIADALINGSGFCQALSSADGEREPKILTLIKTIVNELPPSRLTEWIDEKHNESCLTACYACIQQYGNRRYHGLLDWRLGISYLRALIDKNYKCGLDGNFNYPELRDWKKTALDEARNLVAVKPATLRLEIGNNELPILIDDSQTLTKTMIVHPLWRLDKGAHERFFKVSKSEGLRFLNTFELLRRPIKALEDAQLRPVEHPPAHI